jgi:hypothetical protein
VDEARDGFGDTVRECVREEWRLKCIVLSCGMKSGEYDDSCVNWMRLRILGLLEVCSWFFENIQKAHILFDLLKLIQRKVIIVGLVSAFLIVLESQPC